MRVVLPKSGPGVEAPPFLRIVLLVDMLLGVGLLVTGTLCAARGSLAAGAWAAWALAGYGTSLLVADVLAARLVPRGLAWRRRLGYLAIVAVVWKNGPFSRADVAVAGILWSGLVWVALVTGGRALSRAIAAATGEDTPE